MDAFLKDLKHSARMFLQTPSFTIASIAALALGIATNTAIFSVFNTVLLKPFAYPDPERIVMFQNMFQQGGLGGTASPTEFNWWRQQATTVQDVSAYSLFDVVNLTGEAFPEHREEHVGGPLEPGVAVVDPVLRTGLECGSYVRLGSRVPRRPSSRACT